MPVERDLTKSWNQDDEYFHSQLKIGQDFEKVVVKRLIAAGVKNVFFIDSGGFRKSLAEVSKHTKTSHDISINGWIFEVKSRDREKPFYTPDDWKHWPLYVDTVSSFDKKLKKPKGYIFISQATEALMGTSVKYKDRWTIQKGWDNKRKIPDNFYCVSKEYVISEDKLIQKLKELPENPDAAKH